MFLLKVMAHPVYSIKHRRHQVLLKIVIAIKPGERLMARYYLDSETEAMALLFRYFPDAVPSSTISAPVVA